MFSFTYTHTMDADVSADAIWRLYEDVGSWPSWDADAELITRDGPFATGSTGTMKFRGQDPLAYRLTKVDPGREFVDETPLGDTVVTVSHLLEPLDGGRLRITYSAQVEGPDAERIGPPITSDFPQTMEALVAAARETAR